MEQVAFNDFAEAFRSMGRGENFSREGLRALYQYLGAWEDDTGSPVGLDVVGLCCEFVEYATWKEFSEAYDIATMEELERFTTVIPLDAEEGFIVLAF